MTECPSRLATRYKKGASWPAYWACDVCNHEPMTGDEYRHWWYLRELDAYVIPRHQKHIKF